MAAKLTAWVILTLMFTFWLGWYGLNTQQAEREAEFRTLHRELSQQLAQQQAILFLALEPSQLAQLQRHFPQLVAINQTAADPTKPGQLSLHIQEGDYRLDNSYSGSGLQVNAQKLLHVVGLPPHFDSLVLRHQQQQLAILGHSAPESFWQWQKPVGEGAQSFTLIGHATPVWRDLPWFTALLLSLIIAAALYSWHRWQLLAQHRLHAEQRAKFADQARLNAMGEIATGIAHELNQPLTATLTYNQTALRLLPPQDEQVAPLLVASVEQIKRIAALLDRLRTLLSRGQINLQPVVVANIWRRVNVLLSQEITAANVKIINIIPANLPTLQSDPLWLEQVFHNLLSNAIQAIQHTPTPTVNFTVNITEKQWVIQIEDNGPGLTHQQLDSLFTPFYTTRESGLGLGLTLCETLVQRMGGDIKAGNNEHRGACFTLTFPLIAGSTHDKTHLSD
ncbi:TPA: HAMP domain-containing histidine kinase [Yersinia enterocolitica]|uniref:sensor histidine kinase n=1 Tax=Yersinia enterocolitica TaxID=630 RepID=UPI0005DC7950|nr:HAMP domain-containing sensor histidine kinase [Yersinia enterocolitica]CNG35736.1 two-component sensor kinase [Yersinia enterocolitica]CRY16725.1 two-component sensor kinase [Yersinia enterocolitica]HDM8289993.1 HAMP domain-containing histidine kinase [Yersinia enterocolitica]HDM8294238.1 HAMP domain-containing histidine kinase [Yersinia enterocolitica]HDM8319239.1 HAMP domain-containing histidine kinase [Yersinia enterocolitica]